MKDFTRRRLLLGLLGLPLPGVARAVLRTPPAAEGPFYPETSMRRGDVDNDLVRIGDAVTRAGGEIVAIEGRVLDRDGRPLPGARVEIWQCDVNGRYLHRGDRGSASRDPAFQGFGHDLAGADGGYRFRTIKPVVYPGRTPHIHVKVLVDGRARLTTQFYLPDHPANARDALYRRIPVERREQVTLRFAAADDWPTARLDIVV